VHVIYGGGTDVLTGSWPYLSAMELWNMHHIAAMDLLNKSWNGASSDDLDELQQRVVGLRALAVAFGARAGIKD
jgi:hypothetical protein